MIVAICVAIILVILYMKIDDMNNGIKDISKKMDEIKEKI